MKIRLDRVVDQPFDWQETLDFEPSRDDVLALTPVKCRGRVAPIHDGYLLKAQISFEQTLACVRCLGPIVEPVSSRIELLVLVREPAREAQPAERELGEEDLGVLVLDDPELDTRPIVFEQVQLSVPMKPLCRDDCAGLCSRCGADRNDGHCDCRQETDPRWAALAGWNSEAGD